MLRTGTGAGTNHGAYYHRCARLSAKHIAELGNLIKNLVETHAQEVDKHELCNRAQPGQRSAPCCPHNRRLGNRCVNHSAQPKLGGQPISNAIHATLITGHIFSEHDHSLVAFHLLMEGLVNRFTNRHFHH